MRFSAEVAKHLRALRHRKGDVIRVSDGVSTEYEVILTELTQRGAAGAIRARRQTHENRVVIHLGQAVPKGEKLDWVVEKGVELGVGVIYPVLAERSVPRLDESRAADRLSRWRRVAEAARMQCGRVSGAEVMPIDSLAAFLDATQGADLKIVLHEKATAGLREILADAREPAAVALLVGPEGGFSEAEIRAARAAGFISSGLGARVLRTETAPIAALAILGFVLGDLGEPGSQPGGEASNSAEQAEETGR
ncbi:MAG: 16S rRNA (uracil(1498)-N(3))-methyltransferase [Nitrospinota bacterium]